MSPNKHANTRGFTLVEVLIIAPIVILAIGGFVALMVTMVGEVLITRDQNAITYDSQSALDRIEQDVRLSTQYLVTSGVQIAPQGSDSNFTGTAAFSNTSNTLILSELATDENPSSSTRWLIYLANQPNPCGSDQRYNRPLLTKVIYFIKSGSLWRRTIVPDWNTNATPDSNTVCSSPWQQNSCSPGYSVATRCQTNDEKIMDNISSLTIKYYSDASSSTELDVSEATVADTIDVTINTQKTVAGGTVITDTNNVRITKANDIDTTQLPPDAPVVTHTLVTPETVEFTWPSVAGATAYQIGYQINGGQWVTQTVDTNTTEYAITGVRKDVINFRVASFNSAGLSAYTTDSQTLPSWGTFSLQNSWVNYGSGYNTAEFTKTSAGRVFLKGLVKSGTATSGTVIATLPVGYRPLETLVFQVATSPNVAARIDVQADGDVIIYAGSNSWISLDTISFLPTTTPYTWYTMPFYNSWSNYGGSYEDVHVTIDSIGRVNLQGLAKAGVTTSNTAIALTSDISSAYLPTKTLHFPAGGNGFSEFWIWYSDGEVTKRGAQTSSYMGLQALWYPGTTGTWSTPTLQNSWVNYGGNYPTLQYTKAADGVVTVRGLVKSGVTTSGTVIANLPVGYRPAATQLMTISSNDDFGRVDVLSSGNIAFRAGSNAWYAINISFIAL
jgi:hypothetical protein